jgi:carboxypeptidase family protein
MTVTTKRFSMLLLMFSALPLFAQHRHATAPTVALVTIKGKVTDVDTGAPVVIADVLSSSRKSSTDAQGNYQIQVPLGLPSTITVSRTGYESASTTIVGRDSVVADFRLKGKPTVTMKLVDGTTLNLDYDSAQFAQEITFSNPARSDNVLLCAADGSQTSLDKSEISKITGPGVLVTNAACCTLSQVIKVTLDLKNGTHKDGLLAQSCTGAQMDFAGRVHTTGEFIYKRFTSDIAEIDFP